MRHQKGIPAYFSRHTYCPNCAAKKLPYISQEEIKMRPPFFFAVVATTRSVENNDLILLPRRQTVVGLENGLTPHVFFIDFNNKIDKNEVCFNVYTACGVIGCGVSYDETKDIPFLVQWQNVYVLCIDDIRNIFNLNRQVGYSMYRLDSKEPQGQEALFYFSQN